MKLDTDAIAYLLNKSLDSQEIITKISFHKDCLRVVLESVIVPEIHELLPVIVTEITSLDLTGIKQVKIYGKQVNNFEPDWYHHFDLYPEVSADFPLSKSNKSENNISKFFTKVDGSRDNISQVEFEEALKKCSQTAKSAYNISLRYVVKTESTIKKLNHDIRRINEKLLKKKGAEKFEFVDILKQIQSDIETLSVDSLKEILKSLNQKREHLEVFTVALFGKTKVGKSTLQETLTRGNGSTIGKGSQRTTRDIKEYSWQGLRLVDTPGIEAYKGTDDTQKANDVIDQCDIILFLTSDDSVQPGEFEAMRKLKQTNKYFAVILNVKHDISNNLEDLLMFVDIPEIVFDEERLREHRNHIQSYTQDFLNLDNVDIVSVHLQSGFLSTQEEYKEYSTKLWELSGIEYLYFLITSYININGQKIRLSTFSDSLINFLFGIHENLYITRQKLESQRKFMGEQKEKIRNIFEESREESKLEIKSKCAFLYNQIETQIGSFVDRYKEMDTDKKKEEWQKIVNPKHMEEMMKQVIDEAFLNLKEKLKEFEKEFEYDVNNIKIDLDINIRDIRKDDIGKWIQWGGVAIGATAAILAVATNWWNPISWAVVGGLVSTAANFAGSWKTGEDDKNYKKNVEEEKNSLRKQVIENREATIKIYQYWFEKNMKKYEKETIYQIDIYINDLWEIIQRLTHAINENLRTKQEIENEFANSK